MDFKTLFWTIVLNSMTAIGVTLGLLFALRQTIPEASILLPDAQPTAIAPNPRTSRQVAPSASPLIVAEPATPIASPASPQVVVDQRATQTLQVTPEQTVRDYFSLLTHYQFEQARQYLAPGWNVSAEQFRKNWMQYERGRLRVIEVGKITPLQGNQVSIAFTWRGQIKDGQEYGESWRCVLKPYGDTYLFDRCDPSNE